MINKEDYLKKFELQKESGQNFQNRRLADWNEIYALYRDKVVTNRLTQRQSVNIPLMKYGLGTLMKDIDDAPMLYYDNLDNDEQAQVFYNEYWKESTTWNKLIIKDIIDKRQALMFGRTFKKLNIVDGKFTFEVIDPQDILVDRYVDPADLDSARFIIHKNIYRTVSQLEAMDGLDQAEVKRIKEFYATEEGLHEADSTFGEIEAKKERDALLGVDDVMDPVLGESYVELNEMYSYEYSDEKEQEVRHVGVVACVGGTNYLLGVEELCDVLGETKGNYWYTRTPFVSWAGDPERTDFWSDGAGDVIKTSARIVNVWFSQKVENRTLRSFGMNFYNSSDPKFVPQTFTAEPWGWYPIPGNPKDVIQNVEIPSLADSLEDITFVMQIAEKAIAATSTQQGAVQDSQVTLGEIQLALSNAQERVKSLSVFYTDAWLEFGEKYIKLLEGSNDLIDEVEIHRKGRLGKKMYTRVISPKDYMTANGYKVDVKMVADKQKEDVDKIQKLQVARSEMPDNVPLQEIYKKKLLAFADCTMSEVQQIMEFEKSKLINSMVIPGQDQMGQQQLGPEGMPSPDLAQVPAPNQGMPGMPQ